MRIDQIDLYWVKLPLVYPWRTAYGEDWEIHSCLVRLEGDGYHGWGETTPLYAPTYSPEHTGGVFYTLRDHFAPLIVGQEVESAADIQQRLTVFKGNQFAKAALEIACWVLDAKRAGVPLRRLLGATKDRIAVGADFGVQDSLDMLLAKIQGAVDQGFPRVKLKFRPGWDLNMLEAVRSTFPNFTFHIDCNSGYTLDDAALFRKVDHYGLAMIEQPLQADDLVDHAELQKIIETPICLDESIRSVHDAEVALRIGSCRYVNIKAGRVGGLGTARAIHDLCQQHGIPCWVGGMLESSVGVGINVELATLSNFTYPADVFPARTFYSRDITDLEAELSGPGEMAASQVPGIPYEPVPALLEERIVQRASFRT